MAVVYIMYRYASDAYVHTFINTKTFLVTNPCERSPCHSSALCVIGAGGESYSCLCPDAWEPVNPSVPTSEVSMLI